jgi:hypothetical protein
MLSNDYYRFLIIMFHFIIELFIFTTILEDEWIVKKNHKGLAYYYNLKTKKSQWENPFKEKPKKQPSFSHEVNIDKVS